MCEFNVILDGKIQMKEVIYAKAENGNVIIRNIMGESKEFKNSRISEVDVPNQRMVIVEA